MPSSGFLVISFVAILLVVAPSAVFFAHGWRSGNLGRISSLFALLLLAVLGWFVFTDPYNLDFEARAFSLFGVWGVVLYLGVAVVACVKLIAAFLKRRRALKP